LENIGKKVKKRVLKRQIAIELDQSDHSASDYDKGANDTSMSHAKNSTAIDSDINKT
jgi:hypothetical protein